MKRLISILLVLSLILCVTGCGEKKPTLSNSSDSSNTSTETSNPEDVFDDLQSSDSTVSSDPDGFDNTIGTDTPTPTPGQDSIPENENQPPLDNHPLTDNQTSGDESSSDNQTSSDDQTSSDNHTSSDNQSSDDDTQNNNEDTSFEQSYLLSGENQFYYEGSNYVYGITEDGREVIGYLEDGKIIDIMQGGGQFSIFDGSTMFYYGKIKEMTRTLVDGEYCLMLTYEANGISGDVTILKTTYVFHQNSITVTSEVDTASKTGKVTGASFRHLYINAPVKHDEKILYEWIYPENGDYPYQKSNNYCMKKWFDDEHVAYLFNRDPNCADYFYFNDYDDFSFRVTPSKEKGFSYSLTYDIVLENTNTTEDIDYEAFFKGEDKEYAVGFAPITKTNDNSTVFVGDEAKINLNVTNLTEDDLMFSLRYDVMDYYGNIVDAGLFLNSTVFKDNEANRTITINGNYGMYWINLYVVTAVSSYYECYPFMLVKDHKFLYRDDSPFGIDALHANSAVEMTTNVSICKKLGVRYTRGGTSEYGVDHYALLAENGMKSSAVSMGGVYTSQKSLDSLLSKWNEAEEKYGGFNYMVGVNEFDGDVKFNLDACREKMKKFLPDYFNLVAPFVNKHNIKFAYNASTHGNEAWHQAMYENGVWQASNVIDTHYYCYPMPPDKLESTGNTRENELNMETMQQLFEKFGGRDEKLYVIGETGCPTAPEGSTHINEQADYNTRIGILALAHGADQVHYYCLLDRTGYYKGTGDWAEMNFGAFMCYDYYDRVKPKPWAAAYANMTRQLDGVTSVKESPKYDTDGEGTLRAFDVENHKGDDLIVAWSNIYVHPQATSYGVGNGVKRQPNLPWKNIWPKTEDVTFDATAKTVKVVDTMGNTTNYKAKNGKVTIPLNGSPVYIYGVE